MEKYKILILLGNLNRCNGITSYVMNYYEKINKEKFLIDFIITKNDVDEEYRKLIESNDSKIYYIKAPKLKTALKDLVQIKSFLKENLSKYDIFYCHLINQGYFYLKYAKKMGFKNTILHSHNIIAREKNILRDFRNQIFRRLISRVSNYYFACSDIAGQAVTRKDGKYTIIKNAIDVDKYTFDIDARHKIRHKLNIDEKYVFVQVGRLAYEKNPQFSVMLINDILKKNVNAMLLFIGEGPEEENLKAMVKNVKLEDKVVFLGVRDDVNKIMSAADALLFPSRFEGFGLVAIEAQTSGLPCYISDTVPLDTKILDTAKYISINNINDWIETIEKTYDVTKRGDYSNEVMKKGYDINEEVKKLEDSFLKIANNSFL